MKLGLKIILPILALLLITTGAFGYILYNLKQQESVIVSQGTKIRTLNGLNKRLIRQQDQTDYSVLAYRFNPDRTYLVLISQAEVDKSKTLDDMYPFITTARGKELVNNYISARREVDVIRTNLLHAIDSGNTADISRTYDIWNLQTNNIKAALEDIEAYNINSLEGTLTLVADTRNKIVNVTLLVTLSVILTVGLLFIYLRNLITLPIEKLVQFTEEVTRKNFNTTTVIGSTRKDELGILTRAINAMSAKLKVSYETLEQKVEEKTFELKASQERLNLALNGAKMGAWDLDVLSGIEQRTLKHDQIFGYTSLQKKWNTEIFLEHVLPEDLVYAQECFKNVLETGNLMFQSRILWKDGSVHWIEVLGHVYYKEKKPVRMVGTILDITERKLAETLTLEEKAKDEAILASLGEGVAVADEFGKLVYLNKIGLDILGGDANQATAETWQKEYGIFEPVTLKPLPADKMPLTMAIKNKTAIDTTFFAKNKNNPKGAYIHVIATPIIMNNKSIGGVAVFRDVTKDNEIDKAKTEFVSLASHQLRTPLSTIGWYTEMLLAGDVGKLNKKQKKYLSEVYDGNRRMVELVNALLDVSHLEIGTFVIDPKPTDIIALAKSVMEEQAPLVDKKEIKLTHVFAKDIPMMEVDSKLLRMVFQNLLSNALKYTPEKGKVEISLELENKKDLLLKISDSGYGIPQNQKDKIYTKLFRADNVVNKDTEGTGLGLYIVKAVVERSGGKIWFESEENKGTTFFVRLPLKGLKKKDRLKMQR